MAIKTHKVTLSLDNPRVIQSGINVQSFDKQSIQISIELTKNDEVFRVPSDATIRISLLKLARQEQKIIVDVPNTNRDSIDWVVPDYLDGYQGTVRVGVYLVSGAENVDLGYFTFLSNVSDIDKMADEFTDNVFQGWEQIEADLNELNLTIAQTKLDLADDLTQIDNTIANIDTLASDFTTDVATKQADVTSKYNAFDTSVTQANQTIDDILALQPQFQSVLDETTGKDVISAPEIILARDGATTLGERLDADKSEVTAQLAQKANENEVRKKSVPIGLNDANSELLSAIEGGAGTSFNLLSVPRDHSVTARKTDFIVIESQNLFNKLDENTQVGFMNNGVYYDNLNYRMTHPMKIDEGVTYTFKADYKEMISYAGEYYFCDATGTNKSPHYQATLSSDNETATFTVPSDIEYDYVVTNIGAKANLDTFMFVEGAEYPVEYKPYYYKSYFKDGIGLSETQKAELNSYENFEFIIRDEAINLFNKEDSRIKTGFYIGGVYYADSSYYLTHPIRVYPSKTYTFSIDYTAFGGNGGDVEYFYCDRQGNILSTYNRATRSTDQKTATFSVPSNVQYDYVVINIGKNLGTFMCVEGNVYPTEYKEFVYAKLAEDIELNVKQLSQVQESSGNTLANKISLYAGDSISAGNGNGFVSGWAKIIGEKNPTMTSINYSQHGITVAKRDGIGTSVLSLVTNIMQSTADYVILQGGVNDAWNNVPLGAMTSGYNDAYDEFTFAGAMESMLRSALLKWKGKKIGYIVTHKVPDADINYNFKAYMDLAKQICQKWQVPYIDLYTESGLNAYLDEINNMFFQIKEGATEGDRCHPNDLGHHVLAPKIEAWMKTL